MNNPQTELTLEYLRYINWVRCSTKGQADTSIGDQLDVLNNFGRRNRMVHIDNTILDGISGLSPKIHEYVAELVQRKRLQDDFDVVLVHDLSRLTRSGTLDGAKIEYDLREAGIRLISVTDNIPNDDFGMIYSSFKHYVSNQQSQAIALATTRGSMSSLLSGRRPHCNNASYGTDRRVWGADDKPRHILRLLADGRQQKIELGSGRVLETFESNTDGGSSNHYRLQKGEWCDLVLGDVDHVAAVNLIYSLHHTRGWGDHLIAKDLNDHGIPSPRGKLWSTMTVNKILRNSIYLGRGIANKETTGRYYMRSDEGPKPTNRSHKDLAQKQPPRIPRPQDEWKWIEQPELRKFLAPELREIAEAKQEEYRQRSAGRKKGARKGGDRHRDPNYLLKNRLSDKASGLPMTGRQSKRGDKIWRYYAISKAAGTPCSKSKISRKQYPAPAINQLVVGLLGNLIRTAPNLREIIRRQIGRSISAPSPKGKIVEKLRTEREHVLRKLEFTIDRIDELGEEVAGHKVTELVSRRKQIDEELAAIADTRPLSEQEVDDLADDLIKQIHSSDAWVKRLGMTAINRLLDLLLAKAEVDLETREVEIEFRLPKWALDDPKAFCLVPSHRFMSRHQADSSDGLLLMRYHIFWLGEKGGYMGYGVAA